MAQVHKIQPGETIEAWVDRQPPDTAAVLRALRAHLQTAHPHLDERVKWSHPWYVGRSDIAYLSVGSDYARLGLCYGALIDDPSGLIEGTGKAMRHIKIRPGDPLKLVLALLDRAVADDAGSGGPADSHTFS